MLSNEDSRELELIRDDSVEYGLRVYKISELLNKGIISSDEAIELYGEISMSSENQIELDDRVNDLYELIYTFRG